MVKRSASPKSYSRRAATAAATATFATAAASTAALLLALIVAPGPSIAATTPPAQGEPAGERGHLLLVGGALDENARILRQMVRLADPDGDEPATAHIAVVTAASYPAQNEEEAADPEQDNATANGIYYRELFARFGATTYLVPIDEAVNYEGDPYVPANADDARVAQSVYNSTGVWFGGGDQMRYIRTLFDCAPAEEEAFTDCSDTIVMTAIRSVLDRGGVVGGTSAGLTVQQGPAMVTGGQSYEGWRGGATPGYYEGRRLGYVPYGGFGFFRYGQLDSHFATWSRHPRQVRLAMDPRVDVERVFGLDETTALVVDREKQRGRVIGRNGASMLDLSGAELTNPDTRRASVTGVSWSYLTRGDRVDLLSGRVRPGRHSEELVGSGPAPPLKKDVWDTREAAHLRHARAGRGPHQLRRREGSRHHVRGPAPLPHDACRGWRYPGLGLAARRRLLRPARNPDRPMLPNCLDPRRAGGRRAGWEPVSRLALTATGEARRGMLGLRRKGGATTCCDAIEPHDADTEPCLWSPSSSV